MKRVGRFASGQFSTACWLLILTNFTSRNLLAIERRAACAKRERARAHGRVSVQRQGARGLELALRIRAPLLKVHCAEFLSCVACASSGDHGLAFKHVLDWRAKTIIDTITTTTTTTTTANDDDDGDDDTTTAVTLASMTRHSTMPSS